MSILGFKQIPSVPYLRLLQTCSTMDELKQIQAQIMIHGLGRFTYITSKILAFCAISEVGDINYAQTVFNQITTPTIFDFNSMIMGYSNSSNPHKGLLVYVEMRSKGVVPNARTFPVLAKSCESISSLCQVHGQTLKLGHDSDVYLVSSVINIYSRFGEIQLARQVFDDTSQRNVVCYTSLITGYCSNGLVVEARQVFEEMPERNDVSYSAIVSGYVRNDHFNEAIDLFRQMKDCCGNVKPNRSLLVSVLGACAAVGAFGQGKWIHSFLDESFFDYGLELGTALIDFYAKCGDIESARETFCKMPFKDVTTWSAMILGLAINGENVAALKLFEEMERRGPSPNAITFVGILAACNHQNLLNEAWRIFGRMFKVYGLSPVIEHYGCMVDLLARAGQIRAAEIMINSMPVEPDGAIWGSFLYGCLMHSHMELGEKAGKLLIELEPHHSGRYVLLANMYASMGRWEGVMRLRKMMKKREVVTIPGWSCIEIKGKVHKFIVNDKSHSRAREIYKILRQLNKKLASSCHHSV